MSTSGSELIGALAQSVSVSDDALVADLADGRTITVPLIWFPRLAYGTPAELANWWFIGGGVGIHWPQSWSRSLCRFEVDQQGAAIAIAVAAPAATAEPVSARLVCQNALRASRFASTSFRARHTGRICFFDISGN